MEYIVIILVVIFFIGSISFSMPSKKSKQIAQLRLDAVKLGFKISSLAYSNISFKSNDMSLASYQIKNLSNIREAHFIRDKDEFILYSPSKLKYSNEYESLLLNIRSLPESVIEIIFSDALIVFLWNENLGVNELRRIDSDLKKL
ncbi:MAG: hypothetical protein P8I12_04290 [SAR86 cluster bacterium]|nr:hypothetical protein [SAR86 cluster bacterium]